MLNGLPPVSVFLTHPGQSTPQGWLPHISRIEWEKISCWTRSTQILAFKAPTVELLPLKFLAIQADLLIECSSPGDKSNDHPNHSWVSWEDFDANGPG